MDEQALQQDVLQAFAYAHNRSDWVTPLTDALAGITAKEALWRPSSYRKGIWDIVLHMAVWTEDCVQRMRSGKHGKPPEGPWPAPPDQAEEAAWEEARQRLWSALAALQSEIAATPSAALLDRTIETWSPLDEVLCRLIHNAYHIGQITKLREWQSTQE